MTAIIPQKMVRYISPDGTLTQEGILLLLSFQEQIEANMAGFEILQAERVTLATYGDKVSVERKKKNLAKFGANVTVGATYETVARLQGTEENETFVTTNLIDSIVSSNASDATQTVTIEGHTIDVDGNLTFVVQDAVLDGQTEVPLTTPLARAWRLNIKATGTFGTSPAALAGTVYVYDNTDGIAAGVPVTAAATKVLLDPDTTQSNKCATVTSGADYWFITEFEAGIGNAAGPADRVTFKLERRDIKNGGPWVPTGREITVPVGNNSGKFYFQPLAIIPPNNDVRVVAKTNASTCEVFAEVQGYLALIV